MADSTGPDALDASTSRQYPVVFKIIANAALAAQSPEAKARGLPPLGLDVGDGFIHACQPAQLDWVLNRFYKDPENSLTIFAVSCRSLGFHSVYRYVPDEVQTDQGVQVFPHMYPRPGSGWEDMSIPRAFVVGSWALAGRDSADSPWVIPVDEMNAVVDAYSKSIACVGDIYVDVSCLGVPSLPSWGQDSKASAIQLHPGGSAANTARHLGALNHRALLVGARGDDLQGALFETQLTKEQNCDVSSITVLPGLSTATAVVLSGATDRAFVSTAGATQALAPSDLDRAVLDDVDHIHISGYFDLLGLHCEAFTQLLRELKRARSSLTISLDCQTDSRDAWTGTDGHLAKLLPVVDLFTPNENELRRFVGEPTTEACLGAFQKQFPTTALVVKLGAAGAVAVRPGGASPVRSAAAALPGGKVVDTTGAGDAFDAAFLSQWLATPLDLAKCLARGNLAGAWSVSQAGACPKPLASATLESFCQS